MSENVVTDEIIAQAQLGNTEALDLIIAEYKNLIFLSIKNYFLIGADEEDLVQEGMIGLIKAVHAYKKGKASFKTFAMLCIKRQILTAIKSSNSLKNSALNLASGNNLENEEGIEIYPKELFLSTKYNPEEIFLSKEKINEFGKFVENNFSSFEKEVFNYMVKGYTYKEIAEKLEKTPKVIDNSFQRIKKKSESWMKSY